MERGRVTPAVARRIALGEVHEAIARQGEGHARGKTVISV
ncbi:MAG: zinc-binding dehydrogenase [Armatimonadota bacterium]|nr:MAG: zinc-binding dehydrogenase [Armatimonadota bacterium]